MADKKLLQQLLIASEYLKLLLEDHEERNFAFSIDGRIVSAASLRHDIEVTIANNMTLLSLSER